LADKLRHINNVKISLEHVKHMWQLAYYNKTSRPNQTYMEINTDRGDIFCQLSQKIEKKNVQIKSTSYMW